MNHEKLQDLPQGIRAAMDMCSEYGLVTLAIDTLREWESTLIDVLEEEDADTILDI